MPYFLTYCALWEANVTTTSDCLLGGVNRRLPQCREWFVWFELIAPEANVPPLPPKLLRKQPVEGEQFEPDAAVQAYDEQVSGWR